MEGDKGRLELSRLFTLTIYALFYRPITALAIAVVTIYLPGLAIARFLPVPAEVFSLEVVVWSLKAIPLYSVGVIFPAWLALQARDGNESRGALGSVFSILPLIYSVSLITSMLVTLGLYAFVVPGLILGLACVVVIPAAAVERLGVMDAIRRSFELTRGRRVALFGYSIAIGLPLALGFWLIELAIVGGRVEQLDASPAKAIFEMFSAMVVASFSVAAYSELMRVQRTGETEMTVS